MSKLTWERLAERLPLLNVSELARQSGVPFHRIDNAKRGRAKLTEEELARIAEILHQFAGMI